MKHSEAVKPISYLKSNASRIVKDVSDNHKTMIITQNGEAKVIVQDIHVYEKNQESMALLKILSMSSKNILEGDYKSAKRVFTDLRKKIKSDHV
ncbi:MAG: type II toxin-antitoxin system Phd/YefM family antitoxin [Candidatus Brocadiales bacterium]|nr:type II toxin-antitoxin system Phd/YefM family antitoxin [Candidatus Brocadiales bacterium]